MTNTAAITTVDQITVGYTFVNQYGSTCKVTEIPGKIKGFRMTSSNHDGREVLASVRQMAKSTGLSI